MLGIVNVKENEYPHTRFNSLLYLVDFASKKNPQISNIQTSVSCVTRPCAFKMAHGLDSVNSFEFKSVICGSHVYQKVWEPQLNKELHCLLEPANEYDKMQLLL